MGREARYFQRDDAGAGHVATAEAPSEDLVPHLHRKSVEGDWKGMADLITDEMVGTYAVTGSYATIAARLQERYAGLLDRTAFYQPGKQPSLDDPRLPRVIKEFNG